MKQKLDSKHSSKSDMLSAFKSSSSIKSSISHPIVKQENLTDSQKEEIFNRDLTVANPQAPENEVRFNYHKNEYEEVKLSTSMIICAEREGRIGIRNSNE